MKYTIVEGSYHQGATSVTITEEPIEYIKKHYNYDWLRCTAEEIYKTFLNTSFFLGDDWIRIFL